MDGQGNCLPPTSHVGLGCLVFLVAQLCPTLCPWIIACQAPLSMGILQATTLEWVAMPSSRESSQPTDWTQVSRITGRSLPPGKPSLICPLSSIFSKDFCRKSRVLSELRDLLPGGPLLLTCPCAMDYLLLSDLDGIYMSSFYPNLPLLNQPMVASTTHTRCSCLVAFPSSLAKWADWTSFREKNQMYTEARWVRWSVVGGMEEKWRMGMLPLKGTVTPYPLKGTVTP